MCVYRGKGVGEGEIRMCVKINMGACVRMCVPHNFIQLCKKHSFV